MMLKMRKISSLVILAMAPVSCTLAPQYSRPEMPVADSWQTVPGYQLPVGEDIASQLSWPEFFVDPDLQQVIATALLNNTDLKTAALNIREARLLHRISRADLLPGVNAVGEATVQETSERSGGGERVRTEIYGANLGVAAYELDLFGKIRSQNEAALNDYLATRQAREVVQNALIAEVANAYLQYLADQQLLRITEKTLDAQLNSLNLLSISKERGVATQQDVSRAETAVETARVNLHQYSRFVAQDKNALFQLMGVPHDDRLLPETYLGTLAIPDKLALGIPSEVLLMRPDVREAELQLVARNADIGAARAAFFPSISLTGSYGFASPDLDKLFAGGAGGAWTFIPSITLPLFQGGRNIANLELSKVRRERAVVNYEQAIQTAFREVADELASHSTLERQAAAQNRLVRAAQKVYDLSKARYDVGIDSFLSVLDAQRELYTAQINAISIERQRLANLVNLYKVLGGGSFPVKSGD